MRNRFYLACTRDNVGSNMAFHGKGGYPTDLSKATVYTREEAQRAWDGAREIDQPVSADHVDALAVYKVDCQHIPYETTLDDSDDFVAFMKGAWDGNDVYWHANNRTTDFTLASRFKKTEAAQLGECWVVIPFSLADKVKRKTFDHRHFNARTMVQGAGLKTPDHIKRNRRRRGSNKTRMNCPSCGKLNWQYNPHDFERCSSTLCDRS